MLKISLLRTPLIDRDGQPVKLERRKALALLAYVAAHTDGVSREGLAALFWGDYDQSRASAYLRNTLWTLSKDLGEDWGDTGGDRVALNPAVVCDTRAFDAAMQSGDYERAAALYGGDFMAGFTLKDSPDFDEWQFFQTEHYRTQGSIALERWVSHLGAAGRYEEALPFARRWLALDPLHEPALREVLRLYAYTGQISAAARQYKESVRLLERELGSAPEAETTALMEAIQARRLTSPASQPPPPSETPPAPVAPLPPLQPSAPASNLPSQTTPFLGRERELHELADLLTNPDCRLLTLVGAGGIGKTRLAVAAAEQATLPDGAFFVSFAPVYSGQFFFSTVAAALGFLAFTQQEVRQQLLSYLSNKRLLLVLDNFEHLLESAERIADILLAAPGVKILVTSRERLNLREEWLFEMGGLDYPQGNGGAGESAAVDLFVTSARRVRPEFALTEDNLPDVVRICQLVEGLPLALELAATWTQILSPAEIAAEIQNNLDFLSTSVRNVPERHRSLRAVFEHSWAALTPAEQTLLGGLTIFRGGFRAEAAQQIMGASLHTLLALVGKSLVRRGMDGRFDLHELLRQFAASKMPPEEKIKARERHSRYYLNFLMRQEWRLVTAEQPSALDDVQAELDNLRLAWSQAVNTGDRDSLHHSLQALWHFYRVRGRAQEAVQLVEQALTMLSEDTPAERLLKGRLLALKAWGYNQIGKVSAVPAIAEEGLRLLDEFQDSLYTAYPLIMLAMTYNTPGYSGERAFTTLERALALARQHNDRLAIATALQRLGNVLHTHMEYETALDYFEQSLAIFRAFRQPYDTGRVLVNMAETAATLGRTDIAHGLFQESIPYLEKAGNRALLTRIRANLVFYRGYESIDEPIQMLQEGIQVYEEMGDLPRLHWARYEIACLYLFDKRYAESDPIFESVLPYFEQYGLVMGSIWTLINRAIIAVEWGELARADALLEQVQAILAPMHFPWGVSGMENVYGYLAMKRGDFAAARQHFQAAISIAWEARSLMQTLRHLMGLALLDWEVGRRHDSAALLTFLEKQPGLWHDGRRTLRDVLPMVQATLSPEAYQAACGHYDGWSVEAVVEAVS